MRVNLVLASIVIWTAQVARGQAPFRFEVASIRPHDTSKPPTGSGLSIAGLQVTVQSLTAYGLIRTAYDLSLFQLTGGPAWIDDGEHAAYDIQALAPNEITSESDAKTLLQSLLQDRFGLQIHAEERQTDVYNLVVAQRGHLLTESATGEIPASQMSPALENRRFGREWSGRALSIAQLVNAITGLLGRPVVDKTGLNSRYNFVLKFLIDTQGGVPADVGDPGGLATLIPAIREQLGLILESAKAPMHVMVIDSIQRPSEN